ncbi:MAG: AAA family ATPase [Cyanobacteria bacterium P01_H01_bin.15]
MRSLVYTLVEKSKFKSPFVIGISGIDGSGKGYIAKKLAQGITNAGRKCELIGIDGWIQPPAQRFSSSNPGEYFYRNGFRFAEMHENLFQPLTQTGSIDLWAKHSAPDNSSDMLDFHYQIDRGEVLIFEGIFLFQGRFEFDYQIWIECSYETALKRALQRNQEGLPEADILRDYNQIYFPAQRIHLATDKPRQSCDYLLLNDESLEA